MQRNPLPVPAQSEKEHSQKTANSTFIGKQDIPLVMIPEQANKFKEPLPEKRKKKSVKS